MKPLIWEDVFPLQDQTLFAAYKPSLNLSEARNPTVTLNKK